MDSGCIHVLVRVLSLVFKRFGLYGENDILKIKLRTKSYQLNGAKGAKYGTPKLSTETRWIKRIQENRTSP